MKFLGGICFRPRPRASPNTTGEQSEELQINPQSCSSTSEHTRTQRVLTMKAMLLGAFAIPCTRSNRCANSLMHPPPALCQQQETGAIRNEDVRETE